MRLWVALAAATTFSSVCFGQSFEASLSFGWNSFGGSRKLGTLTTDPNSGRFDLKNGPHLFGLRMNLNPYRFFGYELTYAYNRSAIQIPSQFVEVPGQGPVEIPSQEMNVSIHNVYGNGLLHFVSEGKRVRPFVTGGVGFSSFVLPGVTAVSQGTQTTKFGYNYGAGVKVWATTNWGFRVDGRIYETGKPFDLPNQSGRLRQFALSAGVSFFM